jgi:hypothetical protein
LQDESTYIYTAGVIFSVQFWMKFTKYTLFHFRKVLYSLSFDMLAVWRQGKLRIVPKAQDEMAFGSKIGAQKSPDVISGDF